MKAQKFYLISKQNKAALSGHPILSITKGLSKSSCKTAPMIARMTVGPGFHNLVQTLFFAAKKVFTKSRQQKSSP